MTLRGQIVAFNFKEMKVIGTFPLSAELIDIPKQKLNDQELARLVKELHITTKKSFIKEIVNRFNEITINTGDTRKIQIKQVTSTDEFNRFIKKENQSTVDINTFIARNFEKYLSKIKILQCYLTKKISLLVAACLSHFLMEMSLI